MTDFTKGDRAIITRPQYSQGGRSVFLNKVGTVENVTGRYITIVIDDELDELGFFAAELDKLEDKV